MLEILLNSFRTFSYNINQMPWYWMCWIYLLAFINGLLPLVFLPRFTAIIVLVSAYSGLLLGLILNSVLGFNKLLGLMHFTWIPMVCYLLYYIKNKEFLLASFHDYWLLSCLIISMLSLLLDFKDIYDYFKN